MWQWIARWSILGILWLSACVTTEEDIPEDGPERCEYLHEHIDWQDRPRALNRISELFASGCYAETIASGRKARERFRHKEYSVVKEVAELFLPEGAVTDYVLESYERGYLSFLVAISYLRQNDRVAMSIELNRFYNEEVAHLYNHGQDPVNALLQAVLWENFPREGFSARPFWVWLSRSELAEAAVREFAAARIVEFDTKIPRAPWQITAIGSFPMLDWSIKFSDTRNGYFAIRPKDGFPAVCHDGVTLVIPTQSWFQKIAMRHSHRYHPLVHAKTWIRLPIGILYTVSTMAAGAAIVVGGCSLEVMGKAEGALCRLSIEGGSALIALSDDVVESTLQPDLRHWENLPAAIYLTTEASPVDARCAQGIKDLKQQKIL